MNSPKEKLLTLIRSEDISKFSYRELSEKIGCKHASQSRHYLKALIDDGLVSRAGNGTYVIKKGKLANSLLTFPMMGEANCGAATMYADDVVQDVVRISPSEINIKHLDKVFVLMAVGESMNCANIQGKSINNGDYVFVEPSTWWSIDEGDYVVSIIDGMANIKRLHIDSINERIILNSESSEFFDPIIIGANDLHLYQLSGKVVDIVKGVKK